MELRQTYVITFRFSLTLNALSFFGICLSRYPALVLARRPMPQFVFDDPGASLHLPASLFSLCILRIVLLSLLMLSNSFVMVIVDKNETKCKLSKKQINKEN